MAKTRHTLFLVTTIIAYIGSTNGGYYSEQSNVQTAQNLNNEALNSNIENIASSSENKQSDFIPNQSSNENQNNEDTNISTRYELDQEVPQNINEEQYRSVVNQLESEAQKPEHYYSNQGQTLPNNIQSTNAPSPVIQQSNQGSANNNLPNQQNSVQSVNENEIILQKETVKTTHLRTFYPISYPNYANVGAVPTSNVNSLPLSFSQPQVSGHVLPYANVEALANQHNTVLTFPLNAPETFGTGQISLAAQNVLPHANIGVLPTQSINVQSLPLSPAQPLVAGNQIPVNYNVHNLLPYPNVGVITAQQRPAYSPTLSASQLEVSERYIPNSGVHILPQENVEIAAQPNLLPQPVSQHTLGNAQIPINFRVQNLPPIVKENVEIAAQPNLLPQSVSQHTLGSAQLPINFNVQNLSPLVNGPAEGQLVLNGASGYSNIGIQNSPPVQQAPITPIVTKDIYFHVAPPGFEDVPTPALPPKKTYKIIFIKLPSQERKNTALLQSLYNQYAAREDKTLIYVLVKKPEEEQVIQVPQAKSPSQHEVIFVKYKNIKENSALVGTNEIELKNHNNLKEQNHDDRLNEPEHVDILKPGLINGH